MKKIVGFLGFESDPSALDDEEMEGEVVMNEAVLRAIVKAPMAKSSLRRSAASESLGARFTPRGSLKGSAASKPLEVCVASPKSSPRRTSRDTVQPQLASSAKSAWSVQLS